MMSSLSQSFCIKTKEYDRHTVTPENYANPEEQVRKLEEEIEDLQRLVCHLLEKNERLRMRLQRYGENL